MIAVDDDERRRIAERLPRWLQIARYRSRIEEDLADEDEVVPVRAGGLREPLRKRRRGIDRNALTVDEPSSSSRAIWRVRV